LFLRGFLTRRSENAALATDHENVRSTLTQRHRTMMEKEKGRVAGVMLVLGRL